MSAPFSGIVTPTTVSFTSRDGKSNVIAVGHPNFDKICEKFKEYSQASKAAADPVALDAIRDELDALTDLAKPIADLADGSVEIRSGVIYYEDEAIHNAITERIIWGLREGYDMQSYIRFLNNIMENPSKRAVDETYKFIERNNMGITEDGMILAYKRVRDDFKDIWSGKFDNTPGNVVQMKRNQVDDNKEKTCSTGLHFCSMPYLPYYGTGPGNTIVLVEVHPKNVVSVPVDYHFAKARCCEYKVIAEYKGSDKDDFLATRPVWNVDELTPSDDDDDDWSSSSSEYEDFEDEAVAPSITTVDGSVVVTVPVDDAEWSSSSSSDEYGFEESDGETVVEPAAKVPPEELAELAEIAKLYMYDATTGQYIPHNENDPK
jgi:hypothetical protein